MRLFVAIEVPTQVRQRIEQLIEDLQRTAEPVRWVRPEGLHVTLKFIGEVAPERFQPIKEALQAISPRSPGATIQPLMIRVQGSGFFPSERAPRTIWLGIHAGAGLAELAAAVDTSLASLGIAPEGRPFAPHLTIGRLRGPGRLVATRRLLKEREPLDLGDFAVHEFLLYESRLSKGGSIYAKTAPFPLTQRGGEGS